MIVVDFNSIARIAKLVALLGFFLPWVTVSCSGTEMLHATGWQLMTGNPELAGPFSGMQTQAEQEDHEPAGLVIAAFAVVAIGLVCSLMTRAQTAAATMLVCAGLGLGLSYFSIENMRTEMQREIASEQHKNGDNTPFLSAEQRRDLSRTVSDSIRIEEEEGYWLSFGALVAAVLFSLLTLTSRRVSATGPPLGS